MEEKNLFNLRPGEPSTFIMCEDSATDYKTAIRIAQILRKRGHIVQVDLSKDHSFIKKSDFAIILKKNFSNDRLVEIISGNKKKIIKVNNFGSLFKKINF